MVIESTGLGPDQVFVAPRSRPCSGLDPDRLLLGDMLLDRRGELVTLGGPKPFFGTLSLPFSTLNLPFSSIAYPKLGSSSARVTPRPGIGRVLELLTEFLDPVRRARTSRLGHRGLLPGFEGIPGRCPALGDPSGLYNPGVLGVAPKLGTGEGTQYPDAGGGRVGLGQAAPFPELLRAGDPQPGNHPNIFDPVERIPVAWISPPLELSPNSTRWS
jgi:hypothetical protein